MQSNTQKLIGYQTLLDRFNDHMQTDHYHHAHLFIGPKSIGKTTFIQCLLQQQLSPQLTPDQVLQHYQAGQSPFLKVLADDGNRLKVDDVRRLKEGLNAKIPEGQKFFVCIENIHRLTTSAANALLKTLEEPTPGLVFLPTSHQETGLLKTVLSRVHIHRMNLLQASVIADFLETLLQEGQELPAPSQQLLDLCRGRVGVMKQLLDDKKSFEHYAQLYRFAQKLFSDSLADKFLFIHRFVGKDVQVSDLNEILQYLAEIVHQQDPGQWQGIPKAIDETFYALNNTQANKRLQMERLVLLMERVRF